MPRGGARKGAGRKEMPTIERGKQVQFYLRPETLAQLKILSHQWNCSMSDVVALSIYNCRAMPEKPK